MISWATRSGFFRVNYAFADRYLLEVNGRYDLSSKFPRNNRAVLIRLSHWDGKCLKKIGLRD